MFVAHMFTFCTFPSYAGTKANAQGGILCESHCSNLEEMEVREEMMNTTVLSLFLFLLGLAWAGLGEIKVK